MNRREFSRTIASAAVGAAVLPSVSAVAETKAERPDPFKLSVMLWTLNKKLSFDQRMEEVSKAGYHYVELTGDFLEWSPEEMRRINKKKEALGLNFDATGGFQGAGPADPKAGDHILAQLDHMLPLLDRIQCPTLIILTGNRIPSLSHQQQHDACIETLKRMGDVAAKRNVTVLLENIDLEENSKYFLNGANEGFDIIRAVNHPNVRFLYDFYHEQIGQGSLIEKLEKNIDLINLVHIADVPGRHEPGTGEINYANIFRKLAELKYHKYVAMEFLPTGDDVASLRGAREYLRKAVYGS